MSVNNQFNTRIIPFNNIKAFILSEKLSTKKIIFTNGCFDVIHIGHIRLLNEAKSFGDILIVGLNSDCSVNNLKGKNRPINNMNERAELLLNLISVDYVVIFDEMTPEKLIDEIKPNVFVKGSDYSLNGPNRLPEAEKINEYGGTIKFVSLYKGKSSTNTIKKIIQNN